MRERKDYSEGRFSGSRHATEVYTSSSQPEITPRGRPITKERAASKKECIKNEKLERLVNALSSHAQSVMVLNDTSKPRHLFEMALDICKIPFTLVNMHILHCKEMLARLHSIHGRILEAMGVSSKVLEIRETLWVTQTTALWALWAT